jgi:integrase
VPKISLTDAAVRKLKAPETGRTDYFDKAYTGLTLRIGPRSRTWFYMHRLGGKLVRHRLGGYPAMGVADAHDAWRHARDQVHAGKPPRPAPKHRDAVEKVVADWLERDQKGNATFAEVKAVFDKVVVPAWSGRLVTSIDRGDVLDVLDGIADRGRVGRARHVHAFLNRFFNWSVGRGIMPANPMAELPKHGEAMKRDRVLSDAEIASLWRACKAIGWPYGPIVQALLLTLCRREEINALRWDEIHGDEVRLPKERTKTDVARIVPLEPLAWRILHDGPRIQGSPYVFNSRTGATPPTGWSKVKAQIDRLTGINEPWRLHDLRRTGATGMECLGVPLPVTEAVLGHVSGSKGGIVGVYQQHTYGPEKRDALTKWAGHVLAVVGGSLRAS